MFPSVVCTGSVAILLKVCLFEVCKVFSDYQVARAVKWVSVDIVNR